MAWTIVDLRQLSRPMCPDTRALWAWTTVATGSKGRELRFAKVLFGQNRTDAAVQPSDANSGRLEFGDADSVKHRGDGVVRPILMT